MAFEQFEYVFVKEELDLDDAKSGDSAVPRNEDPVIRNIKKEITVPITNNISRRRRVSYNQLGALWEILNKNKDLATGYNKSSQAREYSKRMWQVVAVTLNSQGDGAEKDWKSWCKYWNDFKSKLKSKVANARASHHKTGGGPSDEGRLSDIELKFLEILGDDYGLGLLGARVEPFDIPTQDQTEAGRAPPISETEASESILAHQLHIKSEDLIVIPPEPTAVEPTSPTPELTMTQPPPIASACTSGRTPRRQKPRVIPMSADKARRALVAMSKERVRLQEKQNEMMQNLLLELREIKNILNSRIETDVTDPSRSPGSSGAGDGSWYVPIKEEVNDHILTENYFQVTIKEEEQEYEEEEPASEEPGSDDDSATKQAVASSEDETLQSQSDSFECEICKQTFRDSDDVELHLPIHTKNSLQCEQCNVDFNYKMLLERHIIEHHIIAIGKEAKVEKKPLKCPKCPLRFTYETNLIKHQERCKIPTDNTIPCEYCDKTFKKRSLLNYHLSTHNTERPFGCDNCSMAFKHKSTLMRHSHVHTGIKPYSCQYCEKTFTSSGLLKPHLRVHTGEKPFSCIHCDKKFAHKHNMQRHAICHKRVKQTVCDICHKQFPRESRLKYHMKTHVNEKYFLCNVCPKRFSHKQNVQRHYMRKHPGQTYECKDTDASVASKIWDTMKKRICDEETEEILG